MTLLLIGLSHRSAPMPVLERTASTAEELAKTLDELHRADSLSEVLVLSTCNRFEVYADVTRFHAAVAEISAVLARHCGLAEPDLAAHLYVHFAEAAVEHLFTVASGLDSIVVGEAQVLGQVRAAYALGRAAGTVGSVLHDLAQAALHTGKRVHTETGLERSGASVVSVALDRAETLLGPLVGRRAVIVGAGAIASLAGSTLRRRGVVDIVVANRSAEGGARLAASLGGRAVTLDALAAEIRTSDLLICATAAPGPAVSSGAFAPRPSRPLVVLDLALPHDVDPSVDRLPGVSYIDLDALRTLGADVSDDEVRAARTVVGEELARHLATQQQLAVAPTVTALRARANEVIEAELARLDARLPGLDAEVRRATADAVRRTVEKLLHEPTVRVKELAATPDGAQYADALRELFALHPAAPSSVARLRSPS